MHHLVSISFFIYGRKARIKIKIFYFNSFLVFFILILFLYVIVLCKLKVICKRNNLKNVRSRILYGVICEKNIYVYRFEKNYAKVECVERKLYPLNANLVVADESRTEKMLCWW